MPSVPVLRFTEQFYDEAGEIVGPKMDEILKSRYSSEINKNIIGKKANDIVEDKPMTWDETVPPRQFSAGFLLLLGR